MRLTQQQLEAHLWGAANILRGKTAGQDYKNYILSLMFYKRLCDQWENEADEAIAEQERQQGRLFTEAQKAIFRALGEHRFSIPEGSRWGDVFAASTNLGEKLTQAMRAVAGANEELKGVFTVDWKLIDRLGRAPRGIYVMGQRTKWGNCSAMGNLSFNWRLIMAPEYVLRYIVTHEMVRLVMPDHSRKFWLTVQSLCRDTERARQWLVGNGKLLTADMEDY